MKKYTYILLISCFMLVAVMPVHAQTITGQEIESNPITTAVPFLTIAPDSRQGAMGDVGAATSSDVNSQHWNASKYVFMEKNAGFGISYTPWLRNLVDDINLAYVSGYYKLDDKQSISSSLRYFSLGDILLTSFEGRQEGVQSPNEFAFDAGYSRKLSDKFAGGVTVRYIRSDLSGGMGNETYTAGNAFATDVSFYYNTDWKDSRNYRALAVGINLSNIGSKISYDDGETKEYLPANLRLGTSYTMEINDYNSLAFSMDINKLMVPTPADTFSVGDEEGTSIIIPRYSSDKAVVSSLFSSFGDAPGGFKEELQELMLSLGGEYWYNKQFALRAGYFHEHENKGNRKYVTFGAGLKMNVFGLDFSYLLPATRSNPLQNTLRFTLSFNLDSKPQRGTGS